MPAGDLAQPLARLVQGLLCGPQLDHARGRAAQAIAQELAPPDLGYRRLGFVYLQAKRCIAASQGQKDALACSVTPDVDVALSGTRRDLPR